MKILFVSHKFDHMGKFSGYERLGFYLEENGSVELVHNKKITRNSFQKKIVNRKLTRSYIPGKYGLFHNYERYLTEYDAVKQSRTIRADIIHLAYLEDSLGYIADNRKKIKAKIVATTHQPPSWWMESKKNTSILKSLDALIVLSAEAKTYFEKLIPGKVFFIPHGIDTHFFQASQVSTDTQKKNNCLFVGNWLRDFNAFAETVTLVNETAGNIAFDIVFPLDIEPSHPLHLLLKYNNIKWHKNIDDESLLFLYRNAGALLLPLLASTANNALLEAASCEVPVITNKVGGVNDYLNDQWVYLTNDNSPVHFQDKINFVLDPSNAGKVKANAKMQKASIDAKFSWETIASQMTDLYQSL